MNFETFIFRLFFQQVHIVQLFKLLASKAWNTIHLHYLTEPLIHGWWAIPGPVLVEQGCLNPGMGWICELSVKAVVPEENYDFRQCFTLNILPGMVMGRIHH